MTMLEYFTNNSEGSIIFFTDKVIYSKRSSLFVLQTLCMETLTTYEGYLKAVKKKFNYKYRIPVFLSDELCLFQTKRARDYDNLWINHSAIKYMVNHKDQVELCFISGRKLIINMKLYQLKEQLKRIEDIKNSKVNIFIFNVIEKVYK